MDIQHTARIGQITVAMLGENEVAFFSLWKLESQIGTLGNPESRIFESQLP